MPVPWKFVYVTIPVLQCCDWLSLPKIDCRQSLLFSKSGTMNSRRCDIANANVNRD